MCSIPIYFHANKLELEPFALPDAKYSGYSSIKSQLVIWSEDTKWMFDSYFFIQLFFPFFDAGGHGLRVILRTRRPMNWSPRYVSDSKNPTPLNPKCVGHLWSSTFVSSVLAALRNILNFYANKQAPRVTFTMTETDADMQWCKPLAIETAPAPGLR